MTEPTDKGLLQRLQAASHALPVVDLLQDLADDVASWNASGVSEREIDKRIVEWLEENDMGFNAWHAGLEEEGFLALVPGLNTRRLYEVYGFEKWMIECVRSIAFTDEPIPFFPYTAGFMLEFPNDDPPMLMAIMTPLTDPDLASRQVKKKCKEFFGAKASKANKRDEVEAARMLQMKRQGMSYRDIAIQNLRNKYPGIIEHPTRYRQQIKTEKSRVAKRLQSAEATWKERLAESSTPR